MTMNNVLSSPGTCYNCGRAISAECNEIFFFPPETRLQLQMSTLLEMKV